MRSSKIRLAVLAGLAWCPALIAACSGGAAGPAAGSAGATSGDSGGEGDASEDDGCTADCSPLADADDGGCTLSELPLLVERQGGVAVRLHVPIGYKDAPAVLLVDTGSGLTFLQEPLGSPDPVPDAGAFQLGCLTLDVLGRPELADDPVNGVPSVGTLGTDLLLRGPSEIDIAGAQILFHAPGVPFANAATWAQTPFELLSGAVVSPVELDGVPVRLILDTGSQDTLWVGQAPQPGDVEVDALDAYGNVVKLYVGTVDLALGGKHVSVSVLRAPSFPSFQPPASDIVGLLGLSSLGNAFVIDGDALVVHVDM